MSTSERDPLPCLAGMGVSARESPSVGTICLYAFLKYKSILSLP